MPLGAGCYWLAAAGWLLIGVLLAACGWLNASVCCWLDSYWLVAGWFGGSGWVAAGCSLRD